MIWKIAKIIKQKISYILNIKYIMKKVVIALNVKSRGGHIFFKKLE